MFHQERRGLSQLVSSEPKRKFKAIIVSILQRAMNHCIRGRVGEWLKTGGRVFKSRFGHLAGVVSRVEPSSNSPLVCFPPVGIFKPNTFCLKCLFLPMPVNQLVLANLIDYYKHSTFNILLALIKLKRKLDAQSRRETWENLYLNIITCSETQLPKPGERLEHVIYRSTAEKITEGHTTKNSKNCVTSGDARLQLVHKTIHRSHTSLATEVVCCTLQTINT